MLEAKSLLPTTPLPAPSVNLQKQVGINLTQHAYLPVQYISNLHPNFLRLESYLATSLPKCMFKSNYITLANFKLPKCYKGDWSNFLADTTEFERIRSSFVGSFIFMNVCKLQGQKVNFICLYWSPRHTIHEYAFFAYAFLIMSCY